MKKPIVKYTKRKFLLIISFLMIFFIGCEKLPFDFKDDEKNDHGNSGDLKESAQVAHDWYALQLTFLLERNNTLPAQGFGFLGIGLYESVRHGIKNASSFYGKINKMPDMPDKEKNKGYHWEVSANAAMAAMVRSLNVGLTTANLAAIDALEAKYNASLKPAAGSASFERSQEYGRKIAKAIHNWFLTDDFNTSNAGYVVPVDAPGVFRLWRPTPPANVPVPINPFVANSSPFIPVHATTIAPPFPYAYSTTPGSDFYEMVKEVYDVNAVLTQDQKNTALFWVDQGNGIGYTPNGHDLLIVKQALIQSCANLGLSAEAYAKAGIAQRDAINVVFRSKHATVNNLVRPVSYIRGVIEPILEQGTTPDWLPFITTPPHPEYPAAHSGVTGSVMQAVARVIGENVPVKDTAYTFRGYPSKTFPNLFAAGKDAGISRLYGGIHYRISINVGLDLAKIVGNNVGNVSLR